MTSDQTPPSSPAPVVPVGSADAADPVRTVDVDRVLAAMGAAGFQAVRDADAPGTVRATFDEAPFLFIVTTGAASVLQVRARWNYSIDAGREQEIASALNDWNTNRIWPKAYVRRESGTTLGIYGEVATDITAGLSEAQLKQALNTSIATVLALFAELED